MMQKINKKLCLKCLEVIALSDQLCKCGGNNFKQCYINQENAPFTQEDGKELFKRLTTIEKHAKGKPLNQEEKDIIGEIEENVAPEYDILSEVGL